MDIYNVSPIQKRATVPIPQSWLIQRVCPWAKRNVLIMLGWTRMQQGIVVELDINSGNITSWTPITSFRLVKTISQSSNKLYVGGDLLTEIRKQTRNFAVYNVLKKQFVYITREKIEEVKKYLGKIFARM
jgi:hypothetical protein